RTAEGPAPTATAADLQALKLAAQALSGQGDGWTEILQGVPDAVTATALTMPAGTDLSAVPTSQLLMPFSGTVPLVRDPENFRVLLYDDTGKFSQAFPLTGVSGLIVTWSEDLNGSNGLDAGEDFNGNGVLDLRALPVEFYTNGITNPPVVSRVVIQARRVSDFSWMLTVRRRGDGALRSADIVVRFSDGADTNNERIFPATFIRGSQFVGVKVGADGVEPKIRKGKFIFDGVNAQWYRVRNVQEKSLLSPSTSFWANYDYLLELESDAVASAGSDASDGVMDGSDMSSMAGAMFPPGIVDVYPAGYRSFPETAD
ncbi:MAG: hypothetical protein KDA70_20835, partial [Planctomycetaceae bacterium]|nr:hypothetical protein [Planctomycetaceae bacterium]